MTPFVENNCKSKQKQYCVPSIKLCSHQNHRLFHKTQLICSQITLGIIKLAVQQYVISIIIEHEYPSIHTRYAINTKLSVSVLYFLLRTQLITVLGPPTILIR